MNEEQKYRLDRLSEVLFDFRDDERSIPGDAWHPDTFQPDGSDPRAIWVRYRNMEDDWAAEVDPPSLTAIFADGEDDDTDDDA